MFSVFEAIAFGSASFFASLGLFFLYLTLIRPMKAPADESNRIAHLILVWEALKSPHRFVKVYRETHKGLEPAFPYLTQDLGEYFRD